MQDRAQEDARLARFQAAEGQGLGGVHERGVREVLALPAKGLRVEGVPGGGEALETGAQKGPERGLGGLVSGLADKIMGSDLGFTCEATGTKGTVDSELALNRSAHLRLE